MQRWTSRGFSLVGNDWPDTVKWAAAHEVDRLWQVTVSDLHVMPGLRAMLYRTLDDALKCAFEMSSGDQVWFRRDSDTEYGEPFIVMRGNDAAVLAFMYPVMLAFAMPVDHVRERNAERARERQDRALANSSNNYVPWAFQVDTFD